MKKILLAALLPMVMLSSCSKSDEPDLLTGEGSLTIKSTVSQDLEFVEKNRAAEVEALFVTIQNTQTQSYFIQNKPLTDYANGQINSIPAGTYHITVTTYTTDFVPAFDKPIYAGSANNITVTDEENKEVSIECLQQNAGVRFIYDSSLNDAGFQNMYPKITQGESTLSYNGNLKNSTGYFNAGTAKLTFVDTDGSYYEIGGNTEKSLALQAGQLWEITLKTEPKTSNTIQMVVQIKSVNEPTNTEEFFLTKSKDLFVGTWNYAPAGQLFNLKSNILLDDMAYYYVEKAVWGDTEITKDRILRSGRKLPTEEIREINTSNGRSYLFDDVKENVDYILFVFAKSKNEEQIQKFGFKMNF